MTPSEAVEVGKLRDLLAEALEAMRESVDNRDGRDDLQLGCPNCDGALPMPHSLGCRMEKASRPTSFACLDGHSHVSMEEADACDLREKLEDMAANPRDYEATE